MSSLLQLFILISLRKLLYLLLLLFVIALEKCFVWVGSFYLGIMVLFHKLVGVASHLLTNPPHQFRPPNIFIHYIVTFFNITKLKSLKKNWKLIHYSIISLLIDYGGECRWSDRAVRRL